MSVSVSDYAALLERVDGLTQQVTTLEASQAVIVAEDNTFYLLVCGSFVFMMQTGFATLNAGSIRMKNVKNIMLKSVMDACLGGTRYRARCSNEPHRMVLKKKVGALSP